MPVTYGPNLGTKQMCKNFFEVQDESHSTQLCVLQLRPTLFNILPRPWSPTMNISHDNSTFIILLLIKSITTYYSIVLLTFLWLNTAVTILLHVWVLKCLLDNCSSPIPNKRTHGKHQNSYLSETPTWIPPATYYNFEHCTIVSNHIKYWCRIETFSRNKHQLQCNTQL